MTKFDSAWWKENGRDWFQETEFGEPYRRQEMALRDVLTLLSQEPVAILEVGCGIGRITDILAEAFPNSKIDATDIQEQSNRQWPDNVTHFGFDLDQENLDVRLKYDLVVASEVLMHRNSTEVVDDIKVLSKMGEYLVTIDWWDKPEGKAEGCYQHDYASLYSNLGSYFMVEVPEARQCVWLVKVNENEA